MLAGGLRPPTAMAGVRWKNVCWAEYASDNEMSQGLGMSPNESQYARSKESYSICCGISWVAVSPCSPLAFSPPIYHEFLIHHQSTTDSLSPLSLDYLTLCENILKLSDDRYLWWRISSIIGRWSAILSRWAMWYMNCNYHRSGKTTKVCYQLSHGHLNRSGYGWRAVSSSQPRLCSKNSFNNRNRLRSDRNSDSHSRKLALN